MPLLQPGLFEPAPVPGAPRDRAWSPPEPPRIRSAGVREVCLDLETDGLRWWRGDRPVGLAVGFWADEAKTRVDSRYLPTGHAGGNMDEGALRRWMREELAGVRVVNLNTRFDGHMSREGYEDLEALGCTFGDVGHYAALLDDHRRGFSLEAVAQDWIGSGKLQSPEFRRMRDYHASEVAPYARRDVELPLRVQEAMRPEMERQGLTRVAALEDDVIPVVMEMERNGCPLDMEKLRRFRRECRSRITELAWKIYRDTGARVDADRPGDMANLFAKLKLPIVHYTEKGKPSFSDDALANHGHPSVIDAREMRKLSSLDSKFLSKYIEGCPDGILRSAFHQLRTDEGGTVSGRFSASAIARADAEIEDGGAEGGNVQQVAEASKQAKSTGDRWIIRELYVPGTKGAAILSSDAMQVEYRLFASMARPKTVLEAYAKDPTVSYHEVVWAIVKQFTQEMTYKQLKNLNFALLYGAGIAKLALMMGVSEEEAREFVRIMEQAVPEARGYLHECMNVARRTGFVQTLTGRRVRFPGGQRLHKALNGVIQGGATGDITKMKLVELHRARRATGLTLRATIHDEVLGDAPDLACAREVHRILNDQSVYASWVPGGLVVPILWSTECGPNWRELMAPEAFFGKAAR